MPRDKRDLLRHLLHRAVDLHHDVLAGFLDDPVALAEAALRLGRAVLDLRLLGCGSAPATAWPRSAANVWPRSRSATCSFWASSFSFWPRAFSSLYAA